MTREEAIETLRANYPDACYKQLREAVDAAIEALKAQDAAGYTIYRQAAIDDIARWSGYLDEDMILRIETSVKKLSSAQTEIIRCKECKWFGDIGCAIEIVDDSDKPTENDFCSFAERRTDE